MVAVRLGRAPATPAGPSPSRSRRSSGSIAEKTLADPIELDGGGCAVAEVTAQEPLQTVGDLTALGKSALPDVWVPDSSSWIARAGEAPLEAVGSMGTSPVVLATSRAAVEKLGWADAPPGWGEALAGDQPLAVPDLATSAEGIAALGAVRAALGGGEDADNAVVQAVLAAARERTSTVSDALAAGVEGRGRRPSGAGQRAGGVRRQRRRRGLGAGGRLPQRGQPGAGLPGRAGRLRVRGPGRRRGGGRPGAHLDGRAHGRARGGLPGQRRRPPLPGPGTRPASGRTRRPLWSSTLPPSRPSSRG